nr:MAG TPA: FAM24 family [Caudoviricetes sp.]
MPRIIFPPEAKKLSDEYRPYMDFTKLPPCFKPGTPDYIKKKKAEWHKIVDPILKGMDDFVYGKSSQ